MRRGEAKIRRSLPGKWLKEQMKRLIFLLTYSFGLPAFLQGEEARLRDDDFVMVCGDSITEQRRYSTLIEDYLLMCVPQYGVETMCAGWNGETSWGFAKRMENDVVPFRPTVATICLGMNDGKPLPVMKDREASYRKEMTRIVQIFRKAGVRLIVVGSPGILDTTTYTKSDYSERSANLERLSEIAKEVAVENGVKFADVRTPLRDVMAKAKAKYGQNYHVTGEDGTHPDWNGHLVMAYAFLKALGCSGDIGTITYDAMSGEAKGSPNHRVRGVESGRIEVESTRYPFCFKGEASDPASTSGIVELLPFNEDLNRYLLVVKNPPSSGAKISWGKKSRRFSAEQLSEGINLAAEFPENPFSEPFARVHQVAYFEAGFDLKAIKVMQHALIDWREHVPELSSQYDAMTDRLVEKVKRDAKKMRELVQPVRHTITVEDNS